MKTEISNKILIVLRNNTICHYYAVLITVCVNYVIVYTF